MYTLARPYTLARLQLGQEVEAVGKCLLAVAHWCRRMRRYDGVDITLQHPVHPGPPLLQCSARAHAISSSHRVESKWRWIHVAWDPCGVGSMWHDAAAHCEWRPSLQRWRWLDTAPRRCGCS